MHTQQQDILAATTTDARNVQTREMLEGVVVSGSWDAAEGVCQVLVGDSIPFENANFADGNQPFMPLCTLVSPAIGQQYAPVGGERALIWESQGSWVCWLEHGPDDTDSTLASGEFQVRHRSALNPSAFEWDSALKLTNDGPTAGDNLGGTHVGGVGAYTVHTAVGPTGTFTIASDAIAGTTTVETPAGHLIQTADAAGSRGITIQSATGLLAHL
ncbi:MAG: hypothetical protein KGL35_15420, partial [Bradyrhizobium sp.]|nr:hypothetical protein [Bradyrhizobium sp.]